MAISKTARTIIARGTSNAAFTQLTGCSVTRSGTTATLTKTSHGLSNGDKVLIQGFSIEEFNGIFTVANAAANTFDYTIKQDPGANPSGTTGTVDRVTLGTAWDLTTSAGGIITGGVQNGNTGPTVGAQLWVGFANASSEADYVWQRVQTFDVTANGWYPFLIPIDPSTMYVNVAICRNTAQAVDCFALGHELTSV
jgi:hypothetical protein